MIYHVYNLLFLYNPFKYGIDFTLLKNIMEYLHYFNIEVHVKNK